MSSSHLGEQGDDSTVVNPGQVSFDRTCDVQVPSAEQLQPTTSSLALPQSDAIIQPHPGAFSPVSTSLSLTPPFLFGSGGVDLQALESFFQQKNLVQSFPHFSHGDLIFPEDSLLPEFDATVFDNTASFNMPEQFVDELDETDISASAEILSSRTRHVTPTPPLNDVPEGQPDYPATSHSFRVVRCTEEDVEVVRKAYIHASTLEADIEAKIPSKSRVSRLLNAYFEYFDPHTPIIHRPTFAVSTTPGPLLLAMLAVGGCYLSEHGFAYKAYEAASAILCVQVGGLSGNPLYVRQAQRHFSLVADLLRTAESAVGDCWAAACSDWSRWIHIETLSRFVFKALLYSLF
ncbi:unnamed protein product [Clonostachys rosea]|uniref:Xylanolytic transcriptional activator regulatory domain-containing protein n=1 Tax=Bionectria ochroleuca TaxID=29856 RepID=A0ABY6U673_BIOOC|nr:unnamed protein product [Clonostachys rosea]